MKQIKISLQISEPDTGELITVQRVLPAFTYEQSRAPSTYVSMLVYDMLEAAFAASRELE